MEADEEITPSKPSKTPTTTCKETTSHPTYVNWSGGPIQAYYGGATPPLFAPHVASPAPQHPYLWPGHHPVISPYGNQLPYPSTVYPSGGVYPHPNNMAVATKISHGHSAPTGKTRESKSKHSVRKTKGSSALGDRIAQENGKKAAASGSGNEGASQSAESGSDGSTDTSNGNNNHEHSAVKKGSFDKMLADGANEQNNGGSESTQSPVPVKPVASSPAIDLRIGTNLWNGHPADWPVKSTPESGVSVTATDRLTGNMDERELKRQKRKQSNRESARRSRLRKQAECETLQRKVESLCDENLSLSEELNRLTEECNKLASENNSIKDELSSMYGQEAISNVDEKSTTQ